ncbi:hypothetical protein TrLO_g11101 [Triparma laevis f. longispina]|uniref:WW domain-containing protein n=1 Tax=Triparma laevis f. longispina TaxID=1714387 RepID=A0A9W7F3B6_9STRA|nr:hypothetical protein TrLO_g11101 [Triparma laevis f. longispina]
MWKNMENDEENEVAIEEAFQVLKEQAVGQTTRIGKIISACMEHTKAHGGPGYYRIDSIPDYKIADPLLAEQRVPPKKYRTDIDKVKYLLSMAADYETEFRKKMLGLVYVLYTANSFATVMDKYEVLASSLLPGAEESKNVWNEHICETGEYAGHIYYHQPSSEETRWERPEAEIRSADDAEVGPLTWPLHNADFKLNGDASDGVVVNYRFGPPKFFKRSFVKMKNTATNGGSLKDLNRVTLEFSDPKIMELTFYAIKARFAVTVVKNKHRQEGELTQPPNIHLNISLGEDAAAASLDVAWPLFQEEDLSPERAPPPSSDDLGGASLKEIEAKLLAQPLTMDVTPSGSANNDVEAAFWICSKMHPMAVMDDIECLEGEGDGGRKMKLYYMMFESADGDKYGYNPAARAAARGGNLGWGSKALIVNFAANEAYFTTMGFHRYFWDLKKWKALGLPLSDEQGVKPELGGGSKQDFRVRRDVLEAE